MKKLIYFIIAINLIACAKDQDSDQYKDNLVQKEFAKIQAAEGVYTGILKNNKGQDLGALEINLKASTQVVTSTDSSGNGVQPILITSIKLMSADRLLRLNSSSGTFIDGKYNMALEFTRSDDNEKATFSLSANIDGGAMVGRMEVLGYEEDGGTFQLSSRGDAIEKVNQLNKDHFVSTNSGKANVGTYKGYVQLYANTRPKISMSVTNRAISSSQALTDLLYTPSEKFLSVSWVVLASSGHGDGAAFNFSQVKWDSSNGTLDTTETVNSQTGSPLTVTFSCSGFYFQTQKYKFNCTQVTSSVSQPVTLVFNSDEK